MELPNAQDRTYDSKRWLPFRHVPGPERFGVSLSLCAWIRAAAEVVNQHGRLASKEAWVTNAQRRLPRYLPEARRGARGPEIAGRSEWGPT